MEVKVGIQNIENLKTITGVKEEKEEGVVTSRKLVTRIQFDAELDPKELANIHHLLASDTPVHAVIGSPQAIMEIVEEKEPAFAGK